MQYPKIMQPTHARWESMSPPIRDPLHSEIDSEETTEGQQTGADIYNGNPAKSIFPPLHPVFKRNFMISDTYYTSPTSSVLGYPGPDELVLDVGPGGLTSIADDVLSDLPEESRQAFIEARLKERSWKKSWGCEVEDAARAELRITYNI